MWKNDSVIFTNSFSLFSSHIRNIQIRRRFMREKTDTILIMAWKKWCDKRRIA